MTAYKDQARARIRATEKGSAIDLKTIYVYPDGHANLVFADGANWPFESLDQMLGELRSKLLDEMHEIAQSGTA